MTAAAQELPASRLPAWRLALAVFILGGMAVVLLSLAPIYWKNWQFRNWLRETANQPGIALTSDDVLRANIVRRAYAMDVPISAPDVHITRAGSKVGMEVRYTVYFQLYQVDLHFHPGASTR